MTKLRAGIVAILLALGFGSGAVPVPGMTVTPARAQVSLDLRDADLRSFVEIVSEATGRRFVIEPGVRGTVTVLAPDTLTPDELYEVFLSVLELNRLTIVDGNGADRIVPLGVAKELSAGVPPGLPRGFETRVIEVNNLPVAEVIEVVRPLLPPEAVLTPVPRSRLLILSDRAANQERIARLIAKLDQPREAPIQMVRLNNANAAEVLAVVQSMDIIPPGAAVSADRRSNALVISGPPELVEQIRVLAARLDTQRNNTVSHAVGLNYADATTLASVVLQAIEGGGTGAEGQPNDGPVRIVPEAQTNTLLITAPRERLDQIVAMIQYLDRRPTQVLVEAVIFEMSVDGYADLSAQFGAVLNQAIGGGVQFALGNGRQSLTSVVASLRDGGTPDIGAGGAIGGFTRSGDSGIGGFLTAIASTNSTKLLSTPSILTLNNQEAEIVVAQNVPFVTGSYSATEGGSAQNPFQTIERQDIGLTLNVTPQINADRTVKMVIKQEVSNLTNSTSNSGGEITAKRALSTTALVRDGNVIMLGGLLEDGDGTVNQRVPGISKLPVVGGLFRGKSASRNQRVLLVLLRPLVISNDAEAEAMTRKLAREAKKASLALAPLDEGQYPRSDVGTLPFDGADLNQPFDVGIVDDFAQSRNFPPLPTRLRFRN
ncbi:general secretion pathway protein GspD [Oceanicola sp. 22II-s10i]|uniref:type II secretion system secretin GspD n=1 Tax=Oceanicola sp. 22II-s10i TaxID=1317116 RepID=UPI000B5211DF|nr:type II secretion system secretin GspD [Oceanicola sp. 22II-s10i]OWU81679.1 general secretion pathway protein GspD [Oceanicola sp. 22II-s10i]